MWLDNSVGNFIIVKGVSNLDLVLYTLIKKKVITIPLNTRFNFIGIILNKSSRYLSKN